MGKNVQFVHWVYQDNFERRVPKCIAKVRVRRGGKGHVSHESSFK